MRVIAVRKVFLRPDLQPIEAIQLEDGSEGATVRSLCWLLDLSRQGQVRRIQRTPQLAVALTQVSIATAAGPRLFDVLLNYAIPIWALGISAARLAPYKQGLASLIKEQAVAAIERAFRVDTPEAQEQASPDFHAWEQKQEGLGDAESDIGHLLPSDGWQQVQSTLTTLAHGLEQVQKAVTGLQQTQQGLLTRVAALERRVNAGGMPGVPPKRSAHLGRQARASNTKTGAAGDDSLLSSFAWMAGGASFPKLLPEWMTRLYLLARARQAKMGILVADTLAALAELFGVAEVADIPAAKWPDVVAALEGSMRQDMQLALVSQLAAPSITPERAAALKAMPYEDYLRTPEWCARRAEALYRALYRCQLCNNPGPPLEAHHRTYERRGAELPEDLTVLCSRCHLWHHNQPDAPAGQQ